MIFSLPLIMVIIFLIFTLIVGLYYSRKTTTLKEYAIGHKNFTTATLVATVLATTYGGGGLVRNVQQVHAQGLYWIILTLLSLLDLWIIIPLSIRMTAFMENLSMAETIGQVYGKLPRIITALSSMSCSIAFLAIQINVITQAINMCINDVNPTVLSIIATLILIFYSTFGGIRAVTITDVVQCITFVLIIPCLAWLMFRKVNKPFTDIFTALGSYEKFQLSHVFQWNKQSIKMIFIGLSCIIGYLAPSKVQRIYMSSNVIQARKVFLLSSIFSTCIRIIILLLGIFIFINDPNLYITNIWPAITVDLAPLFKGLLAISLLALAMSTADSYLNACSVMVIHDIVGSLKFNKISNATQLHLARITSFLLGLLAMLLTFYQKDLLNLLLFGNNFFVPIVTAPLLLAIYGFRSSARTALIGMSIGIITILIWQNYLSDIDGSFPAMLANGIAMLLAHYILPKGKGDGWEKPSLEYQQLQQARQRRFYRFKKHMKTLLTGLHNMPINTYQMTLFAFYVIISSWVPFFNHNAFYFNKSLDNHALFYWPLTQCFVALAMMLYIISKKGPITFNRYVWLLVLLFCLPIDAIWHMTYAQDKLLALALSFCHFGMFALLSPTCLTLSVLGLVVLLMGFSGHSLITIFIDNIEIFIPAVLLLVSLIYIQQKYIKKARQAQCFAAQQQKAIEQETHRANMVRYLDMITTEQFS